MPPFIRDSVPAHLVAHTSEAIDFGRLRGKRVAILGGGASAFDNAQHALGEGAGEVHVFVRRQELPRVNPIRFMEKASAACVWLLLLLLHQGPAASACAPALPTPLSLLPAATLPRAPALRCRPAS